MNQYQMAVPCLLGVEGFVADELRAMEAQNVEPQNGRVLFTGGDELLARANLWCRYGERVLIQLGSFRAVTFEELFQGVRALPWEEWIGKKDAFPVKGRSLNSKLSSVPACQSIIKKAIVERLSKRYGVPWLEETGSVHQVQFLLMKDQVSVMLDTSGPGLHKRGYRGNSVEAPIKETLAASMIHLSRLRWDGALYDPFCGSGTLLIEGALYALNIAPGLRRHFAAEKWESVAPGVWKREKERALSMIRRDAAFEAHGSDLDPAAVSLTMENARKAGVVARLHVEQRAVSEFAPSGDRGWVVCNPPYGERLLDIRAAEEIYREMGRVFPQRPGWSYTIISPDETFEECFGRRADKRRKLYNGMMKCQVYQYFKAPREGGKN